MPLKIAVTGAAGFLAPYLLRELAGLDTIRVGVTSRPPAVPVDGVSYTPELPPSDIVFHLGGSASIAGAVADPAADLERNALGTLRVLEFARQHAGTRVVLASSAAVYGETGGVVPESHALVPVTPYGVSKLAAEGYLRCYARLHGIDGRIARIGNVYGPGQRRLAVFDLASRACRDGAPLVVRGTGEEVRDFVHAADVARALVRIAIDGQPGDAYNVASGTPVTVLSLARLVARFAGLPDDGVRADGVVVAGSVATFRPSIDKLARLGFRAEMPLDNGIAETVAWVRNNT